MMGCTDSEQRALCRLGEFLVLWMIVVELDHQENSEQKSQCPKRQDSRKKVVKITTAEILQNSIIGEDMNCAWLSLNGRIQAS